MEVELDPGQAIFYRPRMFPKSVPIRDALNLGQSLAVWLILAAWILLSMAGIEISVAQTAPSVPLTAVNSDQVVLLKNGAIFRGRVTQKSNRVVVQTNQGSQVVLAREKTDFVGNSLEEVYWFLASKVSATDAQGQVKLFRWCLKNGLLEQANHHVLGLMHTDLPSNELLALNRQLELEVKARKRMLKRDSEMVAKRKPPFGQPLIEPDSGSTFVPPPTPVPSSKLVRQVGYEQPVFNRPSIDAASDAPPSASGLRRSHDLTTRQLEQELAKFERGTVGKFRRFVEPVVLAGCFAAKCHDGETEMTFLKMPGGNPLRYSQRNLYSLWRQIEGYPAEQSPVWQAATRPHAGNLEALLAVGSRDRQLIRDWIATLKPNSESTGRSTNTPASKPELGWMPEINPRPPVEPPQRLLQPIEAVGEIPDLDQMDGLRPDRYLPVDPYDPEAFNRQHHGS